MNGRHHWFVRSVAERDVHWLKIKQGLEETQTLVRGWHQRIDEVVVK
jgi:hypothetical protein